MEKVYCLVLKGQGLTDAVRTHLYITACEMIRHKQEKKTTQSPVCNALVQTKFRYGFFGLVRGIRFSAEVVSDRGLTEVEYIVQDTDVREAEKNGIWGWNEGLSVPVQTSHPPKAWLN